MSNHQWDDDGERCLRCGDKDWFAGPECVLSTSEDVLLLEYTRAVDSLRRCLAHLMEWWAWYGKADPSSGKLPLPPAGGVELAEDIERVLSRVALNKIVLDTPMEVVR